MKIYQVLRSDGVQMEYYFFGTKAAAKERHKELKAEDYAIEPIDVTPTREGIAEVLNWFVSATCLNEG